MTLAQALEFPNARLIFLVEATAGFWARNWVVNVSYPNTYTIRTPLEVTSVKWNATTLLTQQATPALVDANAGSFCWDTLDLYVRPPVGQSIFSPTTVQAICQFYWSSFPKIFNNRWYDPRVASAPGLSRRIEIFFGLDVQTGGGEIRFANQDGFFNAYQDLQWDAGTFKILLGADTLEAEMVYSDYQTVATWTGEIWARNQDSFHVRMVELKGKLKTKIPFTFFDRTTYPNIDAAWVGKAIPIAYGAVYGAAPAPVDVGAKRFKIASHAIKDLMEVRIEKTVQESRTVTPAITDWYQYSGNVYRYYLPDEDVKNVTFNTVSLTEKNSIEDCVATVGSWCASDSYVLVNPTAGNTMSSGVYVVRSEKGLNSFQRSNFATKDLANGEFTLGSDWLPGTDVSVDFIGKVDGSLVTISSTADIIKDILAIAGETNINTSSFTTASARLVVGLDENAQTVYFRQAGIFINESADLITLLPDLLSAASAFLYSDANGQYYIGVFQPTVSESMPLYTDSDFIEFEEETDASEVFNKVVAAFAPRVMDDWRQYVTRESLNEERLRGSISNPSVSERDVSLPSEPDATCWADRIISLEGRPVKRFRGRLPWRGLTLSPGDQVRVELTNGNLKKVLEVLEASIDVTEKTVSLILGDLRSLGDSSGWWVADADVLPARFASLTGYGAGSLVWNKNWDAQIKTWARQNVGYWTDANGFADSTDADSFMGSTWI